MNDTVSSVPTAAPAPSASPAPSETPSSSPSQQTSTEDLAVIGKAGEGEINKQWDDDQNPDLSPAQKRFNRNQRLRAARDAERQENAELRRQLAERDATPGAEDGAAGDVAASDGEHEQTADDNAQARDVVQYAPEEIEAARRALGERAVSEIAARAVYSDRERQFAEAVPDYRAAIAAADDIPIPPHVADEIRNSKWGPAISYSLVRDVVGLEMLHRLQQMNPQDTMKFIARAEAVLEASLTHNRAPAQPQRRIPATTRAEPPMTRLVGSGTGPASGLHQVNAFIKKTYGDRG